MTTPMFTRQELILLGQTTGNRAGEVRESIRNVPRETAAALHADVAYADILHALSDKCHALLTDRSIWLTHSVLVEYDGCCNEPERFSGTHEQCLAWMRKHNPPKHCDFALKDNATGRLCSYVL